MSSKATILCADASEEARLEPVLHALSRAAKGCRFAVPTADPSRLLAELGDRYQVWPIGRGMLATARSIADSDLVLLLGGPPSSFVALSRLAWIVDAARRRGCPVVALETATGEARSAAARALWSHIRSRLTEIHERGDESLGSRTTDVARRYLAAPGSRPPGRRERGRGSNLELEGDL